MPVIKPTSLADCSELIRQNRDDIEVSVFDIRIEPDWIGKVAKAELDFLLAHCGSTKKVVGRHIDAQHDDHRAILTTLAADDDHNVRQMVAANRYAPQEILIELACDYFPEVRALAAGNPSLPAAGLNQLSLDKSSAIRAAVVNNDNADLAIFNRLAYDKSVNVKNRVLELAATTEDAKKIAILSKCAQSDVRVAVCANKFTDLKILDLLSRDQSKSVHKAVMARFQELAASHFTPAATLEYLASVENESIICNLARNPKTPQGVIEKLARHDSVVVRTALLSNSALTETTLERLSRDSDEDVRAAVAAMEQTPLAILEQMSEDPAYGVQNALHNNPVEINRRKEHHLCLECAAPLTRFTRLLGARCIDCHKERLGV